MNAIEWIAHLVLYGMGSIHEASARMMPRDETRMVVRELFDIPEADLEDCAFIREHYPTRPTSEIALARGLSVGNVRLLAHRMGVVKDKAALSKSRSANGSKSSGNQTRGADRTRRL